MAEGDEPAKLRWSGCEQIHWQDALCVRERGGGGGMNILCEAEINKMGTGIVAFTLRGVAADIYSAGQTHTL